MKIGVLGAGTWGMALARMLSKSGHDVCVWSALEAEIDELSATRRHKNLPGMIIPDEIVFTKEIAEVCKDKDILLFAVPSVYVRNTTEKAKDFIPDGQIIVDVAKGIEASTLFTMSQVIKDVLNDGKHENVKVVALSGPTHAEEVALDLPTTIVAAHKDPAITKIVQDEFTNSVLRVYTNTDIKKTFDLLLETLVAGNAKPEEIPRNILILSDMEFEKTDESGIHYHALLGIPDTATSYMVEVSVSYQGKLSMKLAE